MNTLPHRYLTRIQTLFSRLNALLTERQSKVRFHVLGVDHTGHFLPEAVPELASADLLTLELPTTPVRAYLETGRRDEIHIRNIFWQDVLEDCLRRPRPMGVYGVNVNPHVRYLRARFYYRGGQIANDFEAPITVVEPGSDKTYSLDDLGGSGDTQVSGEVALARVAPGIRSSYERNGISHVGPRENPFGTGRHLVLLEAPPPEMLELVELLIRRLEPLGDAHGLERATLSRVAFSQLLEAFLLPVNDYYLVEQLLRHVIRAASTVEPGRAFDVTHVAGFAHLSVLTRYLEMGISDRVTVDAVHDPRFPLHPNAMVPAFFAQHLEETLQGVSLQGESFTVDFDAVQRLLDRYFTELPEDVERHILLWAIHNRDLPPPPNREFHSLADETPLQPSIRSLDEYATKLDRIILEYLLADQPVPVLREINRRLAAGKRRGLTSAIGQELQERGYTYQELRRHPVVGPFAQRVDQLREALFRSA